MTSSTFATVNYESQDQQVSWVGISMAEGDGFKSFMTTNVASRFKDDEDTIEFEAHLRSLASTGFASDSLEELLAAEIPEERDWSIGEAIAEAYLTSQCNVIWPWNMKRDLRTPRASLPGADLVGFEVNDDDIRLALGEVKTSNDRTIPPNVMYGRSGMIHQIDNLAHNLGVVCQLIKWLRIRVKKTKYEAQFNAAIALFLNSGNKAISLFGILIRDTKPNELDLRARGKTLAKTLCVPSTCQLIALYLPCTIADLPAKISGGASL